MAYACLVQCLVLVQISSALKQTDLSAADDDMTKLRQEDASAAPRENITGTRIPKQLILTAADDDMTKLSGDIQENIKGMLAINPGMVLNFFGDSRMLQVSKSVLQPD